MEKTIPIVLIFCMIISLTPIPKSVSPSSETIHFYYDFEKREGPTSGWVDFDGDGDYDYRIDICNWNINGAEGGRMDMMYNKSMNMLVIETSLWGLGLRLMLTGIQRYMLEENHGIDSMLTVLDLTSRIRFLT